MRWSEKETCRFVELYKDHECLWNIGRVEYRNNKLRQEAYEAIQKEMHMEGFTVSEVKQKIKNLRNTYNQEINKIERSMNSGLEGNGIYSPAVKWFKTMDEIVTKIKESKPNCVYVIRPEKPNYNLELVVKEDPQALGDVEMYTEENEYEEPVIHEQPSVYCESFYGRALPSPSPSPAPAASTGKGAGTGRKKRRCVINSALQQLEEVNQSLQEFLEGEDDFDAFGNFIALSLKKMPLQLALEAQTEVQNTLTKFRLMHLNASTTAPNFPSSRSSPATDDHTQQPTARFYAAENDML